MTVEIFIKELQEVYMETEISANDPESNLLNLDEWDSYQHYLHCTFWFHLGKK
jgi:hypothetical protein